MKRIGRRTGQRASCWLRRFARFPAPRGGCLSTVALAKVEERVMAKSDIEQLGITDVGWLSDPLLLQVLGNKSPMAKMGFVFTAQKTTVSHHLLGDMLLNLPVLDQAQEFIFINLPFALVLFEFIQDVLRRGKKRNMHIVNAKNAPEKELEVVSFAKASQLRNVVEPHIHHALHAGLLQATEKIFRILVGEPDGANSHDVGVG